MLFRGFCAAGRSLSRRKQAVTLGILLSSALILFTLVLLTSQTYADGDEAVIGIMAKHVLTKGERHLFFYGQPYGGGGAIEAYFAAVPFAVFGVSSIALKSVALCCWLVTIGLCYLFCLRYYDYATAIISSMILITATALIEWHLKMRGGYAIIPMLFMMILLCFGDLVDKGSQGGWRLFLFGLFCGVAYYNLELILPFLFTLLLFSLFWRPVFWNWKSVLLVAAGFSLSASPLLLFNLTHDFINFKYVFGQAAGYDGLKLFSPLYTSLTTYLPGFFVGRNVDQYLGHPPFKAYLEYGVYLLLFGYLSLKTWPRVRILARSLVAPGGDGEKDAPADIEVLLILYVLTYLIIFSISGRLASSPRYLLPLYPALALVAARGVARLGCDQNPGLKVGGIVLLSTLLVLGSINHFSYIGQSWVNDDVFIQGQGRVNRKTSGSTIPALIDYLNNRRVSRVWCTYFVQWRLVFESNEVIIASSKNLSPGDVRYPLYDAIVWRKTGPEAIILHHEDTQLASLLKQPMAKTWEREAIGEYVVLIPKPGMLSTIPFVK